MRMHSIMRRDRTPLIRTRKMSTYIKCSMSCSCVCMSLHMAYKRMGIKRGFLINGVILVYILSVKSRSSSANHTMNLSQKFIYVHSSSFPLRSRRCPYFVFKFSNIDPIYKISLRDLC